MEKIIGDFAIMLRVVSPYLKIIIGALALSISPIAVKSVSFTPTVSAFYRSAYASFFLLLISLVKYKSQLKFNNMTWLLPIILSGMFLGVDLIVWHKTIIFLGAGPATFLGNLQIIFVTIFAALVFKEKIPSIFYIILFVILYGSYLLLPPVTVVVSKRLGYMLGIVVAITYAGMLICMRYAKRTADQDYPEIFSLSIIFLTSAIFIGFYALFFERSNLAVWDLKSHLVMAVVAFLAQTIGWILIKTNITLIPAHRGSLLLLLQPVLATIWGIIFYQESAESKQIIGMFLALTGLAVYQLKFSEGE